MYRKINALFLLCLIIISFKNVSGQTETEKHTHELGAGVKLYRPLFFSRDVIFTLNHTFNHKKQKYFIIQRIGYMPEARYGHYSHLRLIESGKSYSYHLIYNYNLLKKPWFNLYSLGGLGLYYNKNIVPNYSNLENSITRHFELGIGIKKDFDKFSLNIPFTIENVRNTKEDVGLIRGINTYFILSYRL